MGQSMVLVRTTTQIYAMYIWHTSSSPINNMPYIIEIKSSNCQSLTVHSCKQHKIDVCTVFRCLISHNTWLTFSHILTLNIIYLFINFLGWNRSVRSPEYYFWIIESWSSIYSHLATSLRVYLHRKRPSRSTKHRMVGLEGQQSECCRFRNQDWSSLNRHGGFCLQS